MLMCKLQFPSNSAVKFNLDLEKRQFKILTNFYHAADRMINFVCNLHFKNNFSKKAKHKKPLEFIQKSIKSHNAINLAYVFSLPVR